MPAPINTPPMLRPFTSHGVVLSVRGADYEANGDCPFCDGPGKFYVNPQTGLWSCKVCATGSARGGGNTATFLQLLHERSMGRTTDAERDQLALERRLLSGKTLEAWGVCRSILLGDWMVPGYNVEGKLTQLYRYVKTSDGRKYLLATSEVGHALHGVNLYDPKKPVVYFGEGPWDGMAIWEALRCGKMSGSGRPTDPHQIILTGSPDVSLYADASVLATPGCNVFPEKWSALTAGKTVRLGFDNDYPLVQKETGKIKPPVGYEGMRRVTETLAKAEEQPLRVEYIHWGDGDGNGLTGYSRTLPSGYDVRDFLSDAPGPPAPLTDRPSLLDSLLGRYRPVPDEWIPGRNGKVHTNGVPGSVQMDVLPCKSWKTLQQSWRQSMKWTDGLDRALSCMLAVITSTEVVGDQLWMKIIGPAGTGKSTLCEAVSANKRHVLAKSTVRGFHSGYRETSDDKEDNSLLAQLHNKTLVTKDGDTLLQSPNLPQILSEARDVYDRVSRTSYRNKASKNYEGVSITWLLCGTSSLRSIDSSELGERFLDCVIMESIDDDEEDEILMRVAHRVNRTMSIKSGKGASASAEPVMIESMQLTAGYIDYLKDHATELLGRIDLDDRQLKRVTHLAKFVAFIRARPSKLQEEQAEREAAFRLASQLIRLAKCLCVVLQRPTMDAEIYRRVKQVAMDTARGVTLDIVVEIRKYQRTTAAGVMSPNEVGVVPTQLAGLINKSDEETRKLIRFLRKIGVLEAFTKSPAPGVKGQAKWRLTERFRKLYEHVTGE